MKHETQADHLAKIVKEHHVGSIYRLVFPPMQMKTKKLLAMAKGDVLLLPIHVPKMFLLRDKQITAEVLLQKNNQIYTLYVKSLIKDLTTMTIEPKHKEVILSLGELKFGKISLGESIPLEDIDITKVTIEDEDKELAKGRVVKAKRAIAISVERILV